ncbi:hypothetical protein BTS2_1278 [Bacillus sp. TS-2]|nr:hypothetical protein BTS2_1278 [Bacillus sp. TS-2]
MQKHLNSSGDELFHSRLKELYHERISAMKNLTPSIESVFKFHEQLMFEAIEVAQKKVESEWGSPPAHFAFFLLGSGGRGEQLYWSDQDHGIVYEDAEDEDAQEKLQEYFLHLGKEIVHALEAVGYEKCSGKVMASYPRWCKSLTAWQEQLKLWLREDTWEHLRYALTFFDSRTFMGEDTLLKKLKETIFSTLKNQPQLMTRFAENTGRLKTGVGLFNQLLTETKGRQQGKLDLKQIVNFPYVNGLRLLALKESIFEPSTLKRFEELPSQYHFIKRYQKTYQKVLEYQLAWQQGIESYDAIHYLQLEKLTKEEKAQLKNWIKKGRKLYAEIESLVEED